MRFNRDIKKYGKYAFYSAKASLKSEVANSYLNWVWWLLEPFFFMITYSIVFSVLGADIQFYPLYIYLGLILWNFTERSLRECVSLIRDNQFIVDKVYLPKYILLIVRIFINGFKMLLSLCVLSALMIYYDVHVNMSFFYIVVPIAVMVIMTFGIGTILLHFGVFVEDLQYIVSILLQIVFFANGIFYDLAATIPAPIGGMLAKYNPMAVVLTTARNALLYGQVTNVRDMAIWFAVGILLSAIGVSLIYKNENNYVKVI